MDILDLSAIQIFCLISDQTVTAVSTWSRIHYEEMVSVHASEMQYQTDHKATRIAENQSDKKLLKAFTQLRCPRIRVAECCTVDANIYLLA